MAEHIVNGKQYVSLTPVEKLTPEEGRRQAALLTSNLHEVAIPQGILGIFKATYGNHIPGGEQLSADSIIIETPVRVDPDLVAALAKVAYNL